ncbi:MAG: sn-glycerol-1-phosphate dehydrogenase [Clostridiaceae bacterium]|nr:sn-glycerol-1-phosphate dehydrogenase [Clostridiaceae bacterium]
MEKEPMERKILHMSPSDMTNLSYDCSCGRHHAIRIGELIVDRGASKEIVRVARPYAAERPGRTFIVADTHTYDILGKSVEAQLGDAYFDVTSYVFPDHHLVPNAQTLGTLLIEASETPTALMIAVGSGTINDITRYVSHRLGIPYIIVGTAPSMDGYAGDSSPIVCRNNKVSFWGNYASAILLDTDILAGAPHTMLTAGFGDIIGKYIALTDWKLARDVKGEYYCDSIAELMFGALNKTVASIDGVNARDPEAMKSLGEALCLAGMSMGLSGVTRPASGSEHHMTHCFDIDKITRGLDYPLHGNTVGMCSIVMARFYEMAIADGYVSYELPSRAQIQSLIERVGGPVHPREFDIDRETFHRVLMTAKDLRPRYAILKYADEKGFLARYADQITAEYYD